MAASHDDITPRMLLEHMQNMQRVLMDEFGNLKEDVHTLKSDVKTIKEDVKTLKNDMQEVKLDIRMIKTGIENMDQRLDDVEVVQLPKIKKAVGIA